MNALDFRGAAGRQRRIRAALPPAVLTMIVAIFLSVPLWSGEPLSLFAVFNTFQNAATLGLLALAVGLTIMVGEFDLSSIAVFTLGGLLAIQFGETVPFLGVAVAMGVGALIGATQGGILAMTGISSVPLTLGGYIVISGFCHIVAGEGILSSNNYDIGLWLDDTVAVLFSRRSLIVLSIFVVLWAAMRFTRIGATIRAVGADRRAARSSGIPTGKVVTGVFILSGILCGLGGALFAYSTTAAKYDLGLDPFVFAITAILLGGIDVAGGRGSVMGILAAVLAMSLIDTIFLQLAMPTYMMDLARGALLLLVVLIEAPDLSRRIRAWRSNRHSAISVPRTKSGGRVAGLLLAQCGSRTAARPLVRSVIICAIDKASASGSVTVSSAPVAMKFSARIRTPGDVDSRAWIVARSEKPHVTVASMVTTIGILTAARRQAAAVPP